MSPLKRGQGFLLDGEFYRQKWATFLYLQNQFLVETLRLPQTVSVTSEVARLIPNSLLQIALVDHHIQHINQDHNLAFYMVQRRRLPIVNWD